MAAGSSKLSAVNAMLSAVGEAPVNTLSGQRPLDVATAENVLDEVTLAVQAQGWDFNTDRNVTLQVNGDSEIDLPSDALVVVPENRWLNRVVPRGTRLYNLDDHNYTFTSDVVVTVVRELDFEDLPERAKQYITLRASRIYRQRLLGERDDRAPSEEEYIAKAHLESYEAESRDHRMSDAWDIGRVTRIPSAHDGHVQ